MPTHIIHVLSPQQAQARRSGLVDLLVDSVEGGASVGFVWPMTCEKADAWWGDALASHARGDIVLLTAEQDNRVDGTVQLIPSAKENQSFRAELAKMLVHRRARRHGLGTALLRAAETEARRLGRTLLSLDTETGSGAEYLYQGEGWVRMGDIPGFATSPDGSRRDRVSFFYKQL